ncbi:hypothetical protein [Polaromonas sp.]|uniref:hypothetical protein n=1 Tax=Polaromonas sp. TaxID=1869339 RepID=UPI00248A4941|nr:hypothetical protein [Polaromonas sp.]MDI1275370.1 hypothetical protein [Polaromonas sp.]
MLAPAERTAERAKAISGPIGLVDVFTPFGGAGELLKDLRENVFAGQTLHQLGPVSDGLAKVVAWDAVKQDKPLN